MLIDQVELAQIKALQNHFNSSDNNFSVMTLNARDPNGIAGGYPERQWDNPQGCGGEDHTRRYHLVHQILSNRPTFACVEEIKYDQQQGIDITNDLEAQGYKVIYFKVEKNGHLLDTALFYDASKVDIAKNSQGQDISGYQGLGMHPYNGWGPVGIVWGKFIDKATGKDVLICATHFGQQGHDPSKDTWHYNDDDFNGAMNAIRNQCELGGKSIPTVLAGDFNMDPVALDGHSAFNNWEDVYDEQDTSTYDNGKVRSTIAKGDEPVTRHGDGAWNDGTADGYWGHTDDGQFSQGLDVVSNRVIADHDTYFDQFGRGPAFVSDHFGEITEYSFGGSPLKGDAPNLELNNLSAIDKLVVQLAAKSDEVLFRNDQQQVQA